MKKWRSIIKVCVIPFLSLSAIGVTAEDDCCIGQPEAFIGGKVVEHDFKCGDWSHEIIIPRVEFRGAHIQDVVSFLEYSVRGLVSSKDFSVVFGVKSEGVRSPVESPRITLSMTNASLFDVVRNVADQIGAEFRVCNNIIVLFNGSRIDAAEPIVSTADEILTTRTDYDERLESTTVTANFWGRSNDFLFVDKSSQLVDGRWKLSFQVIYGSSNVGGKAERRVSWIIPGHIADGDIDIERISDGLGHFDVLDHPKSNP